MVFLKRTPRHLFDSVVTVQALAQAATGVGGGHTKTWVDRLPSIAAKIQPQDTPFAVQAGAEREKQSFVIFVEPGQSIVAGERITFTDAEGTARTVEINSTNRDNQLARVVQKLLCTEALD